MNRLLFSLFLSAALALPAAPAGAQVAPRAAVTKAAHGGALVRRIPGSSDEPLRPGTTLGRRDEIETRSGGATLELPSGVLLELGPDSLLALIGGPGNVDGYLARGTLTLRAGEARPVQIATRAGRVDLHARAAVVRVTAEATLLQVLEGSADLVAGGERRTATTGQEVEARVGSAPSLATTLAPPPVTAPPPPAALAAPVAPPPVVQAAPPRAPSAPAQAAPPVTVPAPALPPTPDTPTPETSAPSAPTSAAPLTPVLVPTALPPTVPPTVSPSAPPDVKDLKAPTAPAKEPIFGFTTLRILREKGILSEAELQSALRDMFESVGPRGETSLTLVLGKWATTLYGFVQADVMWHSTQSFADYGSNFQVARPGTFAGDHGRVQATIRDSRIGVRVQAPDLGWLRASAVFELDLLGPTGTVGSTISENSFFVNPNLRVRHAYFKLETPIIDVMFGHYWLLFGWQPNYFPTVVTWPGLVGELFSRSTQLRLSKTFKTKKVIIELAAAGLRPPERDSSMPAFQGGLRLSFPGWTAVHTNYMTATSTMPASIAVAGDVRRFTLPELAASPQTTRSKVGAGVSVNAFLPLIRGTTKRKDNSLSIVGEFVTGQGINDMYTGLTGGVSNPALPAPPGMTAPTYVSGVDPGLAVYDQNGELQLPRWTTFLVGLEYYLPKVGGRVGLFANVSRSQLHDPQRYGNPAKVRDNEILYNVGAFGDLSEAVRVGLDYSRFDDQYADGVHAINDSVQAVGFFFF